MGITISNHKYSIEMGSGGFARLRTTISTLIPCKEFVDIYAELLQPFKVCHERGFSSMEEYYEDHDQRALEVCEANRLDEEIINFLYRPDCDTTSVSPKTCRHLWRLIKDYDDDQLYGYVGRKDCAKFKDFKAIVESCAKDNRVMRFS